jgi:hypothetical protein
MKTFRDYLEEISLGKKLKVYGKRVNRARVDADSNEMGDGYEGSSDAETKLSKQKAGAMAQKIRRKHGQQGVDAMKGVAAKSAVAGGSRGDTLHIGGDELARKEKRLKNVSNDVLKGGPRKGKLKPASQETVKRWHQQSTRGNRFR